MSIPEYRPPHRLRKEVVEEEMQLGQPSHTVSAGIVDGDNRLERQLGGLTRPNDPGVDGAGRAARPAIEGCRHRELDDRDHAIERRGQAGVLDERLQVRKAVLNRESPLQRVRMSLDVDVAFVADRRGAASRRYSYAHESGDGEWTQELHVRRQVAESLSEEQRRSDRAERFRADALRSRAADV